MGCWMETSEDHLKRSMYGIHWPRLLERRISGPSDGTMDGRLDGLRMEATETAGKADLAVRYFKSTAECVRRKPERESWPFDGMNPKFGESGRI